MKVVARMSEADQDDLIARVDAYIEAGVAPAEAQRTATQDILSELQTERGEIVTLATPAPAEAPSLSQPEPEPAPAAPQAGPGFYSALRRELANAKTNASPAEYWTNLIKAAVNKGAVKKDEVTWSGVDAWLGEQTGKVKKDDVLAWLDANGVKVEEAVLGDRALPPGWRVVEVDDGEGFAVIDRDGEVQGEGDTEEEALADSQDNDADNTRYGEWVLPGGRNYQERLLKLPMKGGDLRDRIAALSRRLNEDISPEEYAQVYAERRALTTQYTDGGDGRYQSGHWDGHPNVIAHIRLNDRTDADGKKVLFVEELQSDWGQEGKKMGFVDPKVDPLEAIERRNMEVQIELSRLRAAGVRAPRDGTALADADPRFLRMQELIAEADRLEQSRLSSGVIPVAPFVTATDKWLGLAIKRVINLAVDGGYERVAFANGSQSAERFKLSNKVESIDVGRGKDGLYWMEAYGKDGRDVPRQSGLHESKLPAVVGKDLSERIVAADLQVGDSKTFKGLDLEVGGEGMKTFYDAIVPTALKRILKPLGAPAIKTTRVTGVATIEPRILLDRWNLLVDNAIREIYPSKEEAQAAADAINAAAPEQIAFDVTPELRAAVSGGLPLFSQSAPETPAFKKWFGSSKVVDENGKPMVVYHSTQADFSVFNRTRDIGYHFGSSEQAVARATENRGWGESEKLKSGTSVMPVYLSIKNPLKLKRDYILNWTFGLVDDLYNDGLLSKEERTKWGSKGNETNQWKALTRDLVMSLGYDGAVYENISEGGGKSWIAFKPEQIKSAISNSGAFDPANPDISFAQPATWDSPEKSKWDTVVYELQDKQVDLKRITAAIREAGVTLSDRGDAYLREELWVSRAADRIKRAETDYLLPLLTEMRAAGVSTTQLGEYLHARHAEERNLEMKARNLNRPNNDALSGMSTADAKKILAAASPVMPRLAARVDAMIEATRDLMEVAGLETHETVEALRNSYQSYVPLHRDEAHPDSHLATGQGFSIKGSTVKRAVGSEEPVSHHLILPHVMAAYEAIITRAEKNLVGMAVYHMAITNPNPDWWKVDEPPKKGVIDERANVFNPGTGTMMPNPNQGQVVMRVDPQYTRADNVLMVKVNGQDRALIFNDRNERALRMAAALKNLDTLELQFLQKWVGTGTRWMSAVNTKYNPVFTIVNALRDVQGAALNLTSTEINGAQFEILNPVTLGKIAREVYRKEQGKPPADPTWGAIYDDFRSRGAQTGWRQVYSNIEDRGKALERKMQRLGKGGPVAAAQEFLDFVGAANDAVENMIRVAAYKAALDRGLSKDRAASLAKNLTVNFNRKGAKTGQGMSALYMFFNAAVQGNARTWQTVAKGKAGKTILASGLMLGVLQALLTAAMMDDDEDENSELIPSWVKRSSYVIPYSKTGYIAIPMPLGLHVIPGIGRMLTETAIDISRGEDINPGGRALELMSMLFDAVSPMGGMDAGVLQFLAPSVTKPVVQLAENRSGLGGEVYRERHQNDAGAPGYTLGRDSTSPAYKGLAYGIHMLFHGDPDVRDPSMPAWTSPQPEALRLLPETIMGGVWRETEKLLDTGRSLAEGKELDRQRTILLSRFAGDLSTNTAPMDAYYRALDQVSAAHRGAKRAEDAGRDYDNPLADLSTEAGRVRKRMRDLLDERRELALTDGNEAAIKEIETEMAEMMREFTREVRTVRREK